jgi:hypothetical protein
MTKALNKVVLYHVRLTGTSSDGVVVVVMGAFASTDVGVDAMVVDTRNTGRMGWENKLGDMQICANK